MVIRDDLPFDVRLLKQKIVEAARVVEKLQTEKQALSKERDEAIARCDAAVQENEKLLLILSQYKRAILAGVRKRSTPINCNCCFHKLNNPPLARRTRMRPGGPARTKLNSSPPRSGRRYGRAPIEPRLFAFSSAAR